MKFKATLSDRGLRVLERGFLPTFEKFGKRLQILLDPDGAYLCQAPEENDGLLLTARISGAVLFEPGSLHIESRCCNRIAFALDGDVLLRVLRAATGNDASSLDMRLTLRPHLGPSQVEGQPPSQRPVMCFAWQGYEMSMVQDLPISKPYLAPQVEQLVAQRDSSSLCPFYLDAQPEMPRVQALADRLRGLASEVLLSTSRDGTLELSTRVPGLAVSWEVVGLQVLPSSMAVDRSQTGGLAAVAGKDGSGLALPGGITVAACTLAKHLSRACQASQLTGPAQLLLGIGAESGFVHLLCVYCDPESSGGYDDTMSLSFKLPVREE